MAFRILQIAILLIYLLACGHRDETSKTTFINSDLTRQSNSKDTIQKEIMNNDQILAAFKRQYGYLSKYGLKIIGIGNLIGDDHVISVSTPFIFDHTKLPDNFMSLDVRDGTAEDELPIEFQNINKENEYIWAYQRFEDYVDNNQELIRKTLDNPSMTRNEMLDALCFGNFEKHKQMCISWENEGKIPKWKGSR